MMEIEFVLEWLLYILTNDGIVKQGSILAAQVQESKKKLKKKRKEKGRIKLPSVKCYKNY